MGNKIVTEADRKYTPPLKALPGVTLPTTGRGQRVSPVSYTHLTLPTSDLV